MLPNTLGGDSKFNRFLIANVRRGPAGVRDQQGARSLEDDRVAVGSNFTDGVILYHNFQISS